MWTSFKRLRADQVYSMPPSWGWSIPSLPGCPREHYQNHASFTEIIRNAELFFPAESLLAQLDCQVVLINHGCQ